MKKQMMTACLVVLGITGVALSANSKNTSFTAMEIGIENPVPLYFLDGKKITAAKFKKLNPKNLESVTVLKDQKAIAKYGTEGKNGVILLVSKKSKS